MSAGARMSWADGLIAVVLLTSLLFGAWRGLIREALGLLAWAAAIWLAWRYGAQAAQVLAGWIRPLGLRQGLAYGGIFVAALIGGGVIAALITKAVRRSPLSGPDHWFGAGLGLLRGMAIVAFALMVAALNGGRDTRWWRGSLLVPQLTPLASLLQAQLPPRWLAPLRLRPHSTAQPEP